MRKNLSLDQLTSAEFKIFWLLQHTTESQDSSTCQMSLITMSDLTGMTEPTATRAIRGLMTKEAVRLVKVGTHYPSVYRLNASLDVRRGEKSA
jgi:hypothetical protein